jgi:hypothetical protein
LTGARRKPARPQRSMPLRSASPLDLHEQAADAIRRIELLARLLEVPGQRKDAEALDALMVSDACGLILEAARHLRATLTSLRKPTYAAHP